jgi:hypothetical protein
MMLKTRQGGRPLTVISKLPLACASNGMNKYEEKHQLLHHHASHADERHPTSDSFSEQRQRPDNLLAILLPFKDRKSFEEAVCKTMSCPIQKEQDVCSA